MKCVYEGAGSTDDGLSSRIHTSNIEVQDRLCRLENLIENLAAASISDSVSQKANPDTAQVPYVLFDSTSPRQEELGKTIFGPSTSAYIDSSAWVHCFDQVGCPTSKVY